MKVKKKPANDQKLNAMMETKLLISDKRNLRSHDIVQCPYILQFIDKWWLSLDANGILDKCQN